MISVEDWAEIRRLHRAEQMPVRAIVRKLGISRNTVRRAIADDAPPKYQRALKGSIVDAVEPQIRELLEQRPEMPATVIPERIGWDRGLTVLKDRIRDLRPAYRAADPASRTVYEPGEMGRCDLWFPPAHIPLGFGQVGRPPVLVMVAGYSRRITARMLPSRSGSPDCTKERSTLAPSQGPGKELPSAHPSRTTTTTLRRAPQPEPPDTPSTSRALTPVTLSATRRPPQRHGQGLARHQPGQDQPGLPRRRVVTELPAQHRFVWLPQPVEAPPQRRFVGPVVDVLHREPGPARSNVALWRSGSERASRWFKCELCRFS